MPGVNAAPGQPGMPGQQPAVPGQPGFQPIPVIMPGQPFQPGQQQPGMPQGSQPSVQPQPFIGGGYPSSTTPSGAYPGPPVNSQTGGAPAYPIQPGFPIQSPGAQQPGMRPMAPGQPGQNEATRLIQQILTSPRAGGMPSTPGMVGGGMQIGGGIAGVASTLEQDSIMVYEEHQKYNEWEFIYDPAKDRSVMGGMAGGQDAGHAGHAGWEDVAGCVHTRTRSSTRSSRQSPMAARLPEYAHGSGAGAGAARGILLPS